MARKLVLMLAFVLGAAFTASPLAMAQSEVDIAEVSEAVTAADPQSLLEGLRTPMADDELPAGFSEAEFADPEEATAEEGVVPAEDLEGAVGSVAYVLSYSPDGGATPSATPTADLGALSFGFASPNYVVLEDEITSEDLADFREGAEQGLAGEATPEAAGSNAASVEEITVDGADAVLLTYTIEEAGVQSVVQMVAVPVGNVLVMSMVVLAAQDVDAAAIRTDAEALVLSGVEHLGAVAAAA